MPCCIYLSDEEVKHWRTVLDDADMLEYLDELDRKGERWAIRKIRLYTRERWFRRKEVLLYSLYAHLNSIEWQVINFPGGESSINHCVDAAMVKTYLLGYLGGRGRSTGAA